MKRENKVMIASFLTNAFLSLGKIIFGFLGKSSALIADGIHSFSDLTTDVIAIVGNVIARKPADQKHPFGHGKSEYLTSMAIGVIVLFLGFTIIYNSFQREIVIPSFYVLLVSIGTIAVKFLLAFYLLKKGKEYQNNILIASGKESSADVISSVVVLISVIFMQLSKWVSVFQYADLVATIIVGILIVRIGFHILKENISIILGEQETNPEYLEAIQTLILRHSEIKKIDSLILLKFGPYYKVSAELALQWDMSLVDAHQLIDRLEKEMKEYDGKIQYVTIHMGPYLEHCDEQD